MSTFLLVDLDVGRTNLVARSSLLVLLDVFVVSFVGEEIEC